MSQSEPYGGLACARVRVLMEAYVDGDLASTDPTTAEKMRVHLASCDDCRRQHAQAVSLPFRLKALTSPPPPEGLSKTVMVAIRPEQVALWDSLPEGRANMIQADLRAVQFLGDRYEYTVALGSETRVLVSPASQHLKPGDKVFLELKSEGISLWPRET